MFMLEGEVLNLLLTKYSESNHPRAKISFLRLAIARAMTIAPEFKEELTELKRRLRNIASQANWEAFNAYQVAGRWDFVGNDNNYFIFADLLAELDDIAHALMTIYEKKKAELLRLLEEGIK